MIERTGPGNPGPFPLLTEAAGRCPPEDVAGPSGYEEFLAALADPEHQRHADMVEWHGETFDPHAVDPDFPHPTEGRLRPRGPQPHPENDP